ncbi:hypothetical protein WISP_23175 [Willisornis vidua]|uniref:Uncharacterized protein n=1 Tax=Willisornis vidua TaxID=1566151 RepID=A0ABQ9DTW3_9PASS|nr:hypothetical protein WISP_23175 [Willisornis vidua]
MQKEDMKLLESIQRRTMSIVKGMEGTLYEEWLSSLGLFILEKRTLMGDLTVVYIFIKSGSRETEIPIEAIPSNNKEIEGVGWIESPEKISGMLLDEKLNMKKGMDLLK